MFTGLIQDIGYVQSKGDYQMQVRCAADSPVLQGIEIGDSIAVDGACLTVERILNGGFVVSVSPETLARTTLGGRSPQDPVNLEASLRVGSKIGGHFVTGHVDGSARLVSAVASATSWTLRFSHVSPGLRPYILAKGSVAVNGISLTIASCDASGEWFSVAVIPHTYEVTNLHGLEPGSPVNLEADILGKYVQRLLRYPGASPVNSVASSVSAVSVPDTAWSEPDSATAPALSVPSIEADFLSEHGYL